MTLRQITIEDSIGQMVEAQNGESNNVGQGLAGETVPIVVENVNNSVNVMVSMAASEIVTLPTLSAQTI